MRHEVSPWGGMVSLKVGFPGALLGMALLAAPSRLGAQESAPRNVNTAGLDTLGKEWRATNPYRNNPKAVEIGKEGYNQNCARCHGLEGISGGFTPDLRRLPLGTEGDALFVFRVQAGSFRNGIQYMPKMAQVLNQETLWAIRTYLESIHEE